MQIFLSLLDTLGKGIITTISLACYITGTLAQHIVNIATGQQTK